MGPNAEPPGTRLPPTANSRRPAQSQPHRRPLGERASGHSPSPSRPRVLPEAGARFFGRADVRRLADRRPLHARPHGRIGVVIVTVPPPRRPGRRHRHLPRHAAPHHVDRGTPSAISDTGTIRVASDDHGWGITIDGVIWVVASTSRPASAGQRRDPRPRRRCRRRARHRRDRPLDPPPGPAPAALTPSPPRRAQSDPRSPCPSARVEGVRPAAPDPHRWSSLDGDPSWPSIPPPSGG